MSLTSRAPHQPGRQVRDQPLGLRITRSLKSELQRLAREDGRTLAAYVERVLLAHVADGRKKRGKG